MMQTAVIPRPLGDIFFSFSEQLPKFWVLYVFINELVCSSRKIEISEDKKL